MKAPLLAALLLALPFAGCLGDEGEPLAQGLAPKGPPEGSENGWADESEAIIRPGSILRTPARECVSNFVFTRPDNGSVFLGTSANCVRDQPVGTLATIGDDEHLAVLIYSSWQTMAERNETDPDAREYNDFAVFYIDSSSRADVSPRIPGVGGPTGAADPAGLPTGALLRAHTGAARTVDTPVVSLGVGRPIETGPAWRDAVVTGRAGDWALLVHGAPPALPGTFGGAVLTPEGRAVGLLVSLGVAPNPGQNAVARLDAVMAYAAEHANLEMVLATAG